MAKWTAEVSIRQAGKSYYKSPPTFVSVEAGTYVAAVGAATREAKKRLAATAKGLRVEAVLVKVERVRERGDRCLGVTAATTSPIPRPV